MAFGAIGLGRQAECLFAVVVNHAILVLGVISLGNFCVFLHLKGFRVAVRALRLMLVYVRFMAEKDRSLGLAFIFYIPSAHFLLSEGNAQGCKAYDADADYQNPPELIAHFFTSFP
jgi:hypothetical protein